MAAERQDRRVTRTRRLLQDALVALILERGYAAITVQAVLDRAEIGRATFYNHFPNKEALLLSVFDALQDSLRRELGKLTPAVVARFGEGIGLLTPLFTHAAEHRRLYRALLGSRDGAALLRYLGDAVASPLRQHLETVLAQRGRPPTAQLELVVTAFVSAVLGVLVWWIETEMPFPPAEVDRIVERLMSLGVAQALDLHPPNAHPASVHRHPAARG